jgi:hypothetical protein
MPIRYGKAVAAITALPGDEEERRARYIERIEKKLKKINTFLKGAKGKPGPSGQEVQSNITGNESARIKGPHGYMQGYNGIAAADAENQVIIAAEAIGSGAESGCLPEMLDSLNETMQEITGKEEPLKKSLVTADTGYFSEENCFPRKACRKLKTKISMSLSPIRNSGSGIRVLTGEKGTRTHQHRNTLV